MLVKSKTTVLKESMRERERERERKVPLSRIHTGKRRKEGREETPFSLLLPPHPPPSPILAGPPQIKLHPSPQQQQKQISNSDAPAAMQ